MALADAIADIENGFEQLEFAIRLLSACELGKIDPSIVDDAHTVQQPGGMLNFPAGKFATTERLVRAASINVLIAAAATALTLDRGFEVAGIARDPCATDQVGMLRLLVYMVRSAYAHDIASPRWEVRGHFQRQLKLTLEGGDYVIDLTHLHGQTFTIDDIGGYLNWYRIYRASMSVIKPNP